MPVVSCFGTQARKPPCQPGGHHAIPFGFSTPSGPDSAPAVLSEDCPGPARHAEYLLPGRHHRHGLRSRTSTTPWASESVNWTPRPLAREPSPSSGAAGTTSWVRLGSSALLAGPEAAALQYLVHPVPLDARREPRDIGGDSQSRSRSTSRIGGSPKNLLYSRLK